MSNKDLQEARINKADEFYTSYEDIAAEISCYLLDLWHNRSVYLPCDDYRESAFWKFFSDNFDNLSLKSLTATCYVCGGHGIKAELHRDHLLEVSYLKGDGDFASSEVKSLMKSSGIIVTNPPFSLFRKFIKQILWTEKDYLIMGNVNAVTYREVFPDIVCRRMKIGPSIRSGDRKFRVPDDYELTGTACTVEDGVKYIRVKGVCWFTNMQFESPELSKPLKEKFDFSKYEVFDTYPGAINVNSVKEIPYDYKGEIAVPATAVLKSDSEGYIVVPDPDGNVCRYEIKGMLNSGNGLNFDFAKPIIKNKCRYKRIILEKIVDK